MGGATGWFAYPIQPLHPRKPVRHLPRARQSRSCRRRPTLLQASSPFRPCYIVWPTTAYQQVANDNVAACLEPRTHTRNLLPTCRANSRVRRRSGGETSPREPQPSSAILTAGPGMASAGAAAAAGPPSLAPIKKADASRSGETHEKANVTCTLLLLPRRAFLRQTWACSLGSLGGDLGGADRSDYSVYSVLDSQSGVKQLYRLPISLAPLTPHAIHPFSAVSSVARQRPLAWKLPSGRRLGPSSPRSPEFPDPGSGARHGRVLGDSPLIRNAGGCQALANGPVLACAAALGDMQSLGITS